MTTDITRKPRRCPSCGKENPPTAVRCSFCFTPLDGAIQTTPTPASDDRFTVRPYAQSPHPPRNGCFDAFGLVVIILFTPVAAGLTFVLTCLGTAYVAEPALGVRDDIGYTFALSGVAAVAVAALIIVAYRRAGRARK